MSKTTSKTYTVMVLEDEVLLLRAITTKLEKSGIKIVSCTTGKQALGYLADLPEMPDVIWLDYYLTDMTGLDFLHEIKKNKKWASIPVVVVSNSASDDKVKNMLALGANKYLLKAEYRLEEIVNVVGQLVKDSK